jgi:hypothetical protein
MIDGAIPFLKLQIHWKSGTVDSKETTVIWVLMFGLRLIS